MWVQMPPHDPEPSIPACSSAISPGSTCHLEAGSDPAAVARRRPRLGLELQLGLTTPLLISQFD